MNQRQNTLVIIGAGPKGLAVAVKAKVLQEFGFAVDQVILIEKNDVAAHWSGEYGYTNGEMKLGTPPEKDLVFPIEIDIQNDALNKRIQKRLLDFSWMSFLVQSKRYADWIDRNRPAPPHKLWAAYLQWVAAQLESQISILRAEVSMIDLTPDGNRWALSLKKQNQTSMIHADRLMLTGPGKVNANFRQPSQTTTTSIYDLENFWQALKARKLAPSGKLAIIGAGEQTASALLALAQYSSQLKVDVIAPKGFIASRAESHYENQLYSQPDQYGWKTLQLQDRQDFINRTDLGVFSQQALHILRDEVHHRIIAGRVIEISSTQDRVLLTLLYQQKSITKEYDQVILATGFDQITMLTSLLSQRAKTKLAQTLLSPITQQTLATRIDTDLSVKGMFPYLHLPMCATLMQGPGFSNLSCLGRLSDRIITSFVYKQIHSANQKFISLQEAQ